MYASPQTKRKKKTSEIRIIHRVSDMANKLERRLYNIIKRKPNSSTVKQLIEQGVDCNLSYFDSYTLTFISPIHLSLEKDRYRTLRLLYKYRNSLTKIQLEKHLIFYINHHDPWQEEKNELLLEYTVSRLLHVDIMKHSTEEFYTLVAALCDFDNAKRRGQDLCLGSQQDFFLQLRIFTLVQYIVKMHTNFPIIINIEELTILQNELLHNLETYYFFNNIRSIPVQITEELNQMSFIEIELTQPILMEFYRCIATNVLNKVEQLQLNQEYTIPTGWDKHAVCVSFRRISQTHIHIRVDNSSSGNPQNGHRVDRSINNYHRIKPRILGQLDVNNLKDNFDYFIALIDSIKRNLTPKEGILLIYDCDHRIVHLDRKHTENIPTFVEQADANCFLKCFEPGFRMRLGETHKRLCEKLMSFETINANLLAKRCEENLQRDPVEVSNRFTSLAREGDASGLPITKKIRLQEQLRRGYQQHYQHILSIAISGSSNHLPETYIPLQFETDDTPIEPASFFVETRVLVLGEAGCGKTTVCQHLTYLWSCSRIWQSKFDWLFYINMRNLNSKFYPLQSNNYSLIDIIDRECFQGYNLDSLDILELESQLTHPSNILWILDGMDERTVPDHLHSIEQELLAKPHLLLTSRPYEIYDFKYDIPVKIEGFTYQNIENYINKYFSIMFRTTATECWSFIRSSEQLLETARIPACLEIICSLWENGKVRLEFDMTMGQLYQKMCEHLLRQYLLKFHRQCNSSLAGRDIYQEPNALAFTHMEHLAFHLTKSGRFTISGYEIKDVARSLFLSVLQIGLLISKPGTYYPELVGRIYYFVHRSFQEYLSTRYMIKALSSDNSTEQEKEVLQFIRYEKYNRRLRDIFRLFFELKRSSLCTDRFWSAVDSEPRDLVGLRHCSRITHWFPKGSCILSFEDEQKIDKRTTDTILKWISNRHRLPHDIGNTYIFESFAGTTGYHCWLEAWKEDLYIKDSSKRRYFLSDLWSTENIEVLKRIFDDISNNVEAFHNLITTGPNTISLKRLRLESDTFSLYKIDNQTEVSEFIIAVQERASRHEPITTSEDFCALLQNYSYFANLNRQSAAHGSIIWRLEIDPSALKNITNKTLHLLLQLIQNHALFFRYFKLPVIPFIKLYINQNDMNVDILSLIVLITISSDCILTVSLDERRLIRIHENDTFVDIEMDEHHRSKLLIAFDEARDAYGYSSFFRQNY